jgi:thiamine biosynthesis lipoprotein
MTAECPATERARPLLGTLVATRVRGLGEREAHRAIDEAFGEIELIHSRMSFHEAGSDVSMLNRDAHRRPVRVHPYTYDVLRLAREFSEASEGSFDVTVATVLVNWGFLPSPSPEPHPDPLADWRDIDLQSGCHVRFRRPLWIDLGGIAKGYAVDRAIEKLRQHGAPAGSVNAGGDIRVYGQPAESVALRLELGPSRELPVVKIQNGSIASSDGAPARRPQRGTIRAPHIDSRTHRPSGLRCFVSVVAPDCVTADSLTKAVLVRRDRSDELLKRYGATAFLYRFNRGWRRLGLDA